MNWEQSDTGVVIWSGMYNTSYGGEFEYWYVEGFPAEFIRE